MDLINIEPLDARIPQWDLGNLHERSCPFCGTNNIPLLKRPDKLPLSCCNMCGCWYVSSIPPESSILELYKGYYTYHRPAMLSREKASVMIKNAKKLSNSNWQIQYLSKILGGLKGKQILEIGCGLCSFLLMAREKGADVIGCDLSSEASEFANKYLGINVHCSNLESCVSSIDKVDAVVMRDLIEHPIDPITVINDSIKILKPKGLILIYTPNGGEAGNNYLTGQKWVGFQVDLEHLQYLSTNTINWLARTKNMNIEYLTTYGFPGLKGIDELPYIKSHERILDRMKDIVKRIPYMKKIAKGIKTLKAEISSDYHDPQIGTYSLFSVLRKM